MHRPERGCEIERAPTQATAPEHGCEQLALIERVDTASQQAFPRPVICRQCHSHPDVLLGSTLPTGWDKESSQLSSDPLGRSPRASALALMICTVACTTCLHFSSPRSPASRFGSCDRLSEVSAQDSAEFTDQWRAPQILWIDRVASEAGERA